MSTIQEKMHTFNECKIANNQKPFETIVWNGLYILVPRHEIARGLVRMASLTHNKEYLDVPHYLQTHTLNRRKSVLWVKNPQ